MNGSAVISTTRAVQQQPDFTRFVVLTVPDLNPKNLAALLLRRNHRLLMMAALDFWDTSIIHNHLRRLAIEQHPQRRTGVGRNQ